MKTIAILLLAVSSIGFAQTMQEQNVPPGFHTHDGFYLSLDGGPAVGSITLNATNALFSSMEFGGGGFQFDFKIGGVISETQNLILSFDLISRAISSPTITIDGNAASTTSTVMASDGMYGVGITKYFMPSNTFLNATVGITKFTLQINNTSSTSQSGLGLQIRAGKEWWVSSDWGLGVAAGFAYLSAHDQSDPNYPAYSATISTTKLFVVFNATYN